MHELVVQFWAVYKNTSLDAVYSIVICFFNVRSYPIVDLMLIFFKFSNFRKSCKNIQDLQKTFKIGTADTEWNNFSCKELLR